jgi:hypothetical protein
MDKLPTSSKITLLTFLSPSHYLPAQFSTYHMPQYIIVVDKNKEIESAVVKNSDISDEKGALRELFKCMKREKL